MRSSLSLTWHDTPSVIVTENGTPVARIVCTHPISGNSGLPPCPSRCRDAPLYSFTASQAAIPDLASMLLLALGGLVVLRRRP